MRTLVLSGAALAALFCSPLVAEDGGPPERGQRPDPLTWLDADGSGGVSLAEFEASKRHQMAVEAGLADGLAAAFADADADGDGALSGEELAVFHVLMKVQQFARIDADADGQLTEAEMKAFHESRRPVPGERRGPGEGLGRGDGQGHGHGQGLGPHDGRGPDGDARRPDPAERFRAADTDGSGGLNLEEFQALPPRPRFGHRGQGRNCRGGPQSEG